MFYEVHDGEDMFEPIFIDSPLDAVRSEVDHVQKEFGDCLTEQDMGREELETLALLLERNAAGNPQKIAKAGSDLLEKAEAKLKSAAEDLQRFDGESAAASATGQRANRFTKAAQALMNARERLREIADSH